MITTPSSWSVRTRRALLAAAVCAGFGVFAATASAAEPPNQNDPCSSVGRDTCNTTGVGSYQRYRYGIRWFGDYRRVIDGIPPAFCIDLRFWYPSPSYSYEEITPRVLRNKAGAVVPVVKQRRMAYALWNFGRSTSSNQQAAVMLYVHGLMGDGAPGEAAPDAIGPRVEAIYRRIERQAERLHGPYRTQARIAGKLTVGTPGVATFKVLSARGVPVSGVTLNLRTTGASGVPARVRTGQNGLARVKFTPDSTDGVKISATSGKVASTLPRYFAPTKGAAARNGQRLTTGAAQQLQLNASAAVAKSTVRVATLARPKRLLVTGATRDRLTIVGLPGDRTTKVQVLLHGPYRSARDARTCSTEPFDRKTIDVKGPGRIATPVFRPTKPGFYTYQVIIDATDDHTGVTTPCGVAAETIRVDTQPAVRTQASANRTEVGQPLSDTVVVTGLNGEPGTVDVSLYGPFGTRDAVTCESAPIWSGSVNATGDGEYVTDRFTPTVPGYYTYREVLQPGGFVRKFEGKCGELSEGVVVTGQPRITSQISAVSPSVNDQVSDRVIVAGMGALSTKIQMQLWGPYATRAEMTCSGTPRWSGELDAPIGDGLYTTPSVRLTEAGFYTYTAMIPPGEANPGVITTCGEASETAEVIARPTVTTLASAEVVKPGSTILDRVRVKGLGRTKATVDLELFGPFATKAAMRCTGTPYWRGQFEVNGDGTHRSPRVKVDRAGFYTFREKLVGTSQVVGTQGECGVAAETSLGAPLILTGRGDPRPSNTTVQLQTTGSAPRRITVSGLSVDAPVYSVGIDLRQGILDVPIDIDRAGWWRDGAAPGDRTGAVLIAGHVDSARRGPGAFFSLKRATSSTRVQVQTAGGRTITYRVVTVRAYRKQALPRNIFSTRGRARLVLVTCGGPFIASEGHYRDNIVVTAVPVGR
ncbi:MAG: class F sortase [Thermoleophilia bacterium]